MSDVQEIEISIEDAKAKIEKLDALNRLSQNKDFQNIIDTGYFVEKAAETVMIKASPEMDTPEKQASCVKTIDAIGELRQYFYAITQQGNMARRELENHEGELQGALQEDLQEAS